MENEKLKFSTETIEENEQWITKYFINGKETDENTFINLQEDQFYKNSKNKGFKINKSKIVPEEVIENESESDDSPEYEYIMNIINNIKEAESDEEAMEILCDEVEFQVSQAYIQGQIDISKTFAKSIKITARNLQSELEDCIEDHGFEVDDE